MYTVNRANETGERKVVASFDDGAAWEAWCQNFAIRKSNPDDSEPDLCVDNDGKAWIQVGYTMLPAEAVS